MIKLETFFSRGRFEYILTEGKDEWPVFSTYNLRNIERQIAADGLSTVYVTQFHSKYAPEEFGLFLENCLYVDMIRSGWLNGPLRLVVPV